MHLSAKYTISTILYNTKVLKHLKSLYEIKWSAKCKCVCLLSDTPSSSTDFTIYTPGIDTHSYMVSSPLGKIPCIFCISYIHNSPFVIPPGTHHCWVNRGGTIWKVCPTPVHVAGSMSRAPVTFPRTNRAQHCLTSVIWRELVTTRPCVINMTYSAPNDTEILQSQTKAMFTSYELANMATCLPSLFEFPYHGDPLSQW